MSLSPSITAKDCMTTNVVSLSPDMDVMAAMRYFFAHRISGAPVIDERGELVGILTERDCLRSIVVASYHGEGYCGEVAEFMTRDVVSVEAATSLLDIAQLFVTTICRRFPVVDEGRVVGVISRRDVIRAVLELA
jgi:CBS domain-containing protein